jgi:cytochrome c-type biogenesis protein CcmF
MDLLGRGLLVLALAIAVYGTVASVVGARRLRAPSAAGPDGVVEPLVSAGGTAWVTSARP